jgi:hypothetical protein
MNKLTCRLPNICSDADAVMAATAIHRNVSDGSLAVCSSMDFATRPSACADGLSRANSVAMRVPPKRISSACVVRRIANIRIDERATFVSLQARDPWGQGSGINSARDQLERLTSRSVDERRTVFSRLMTATSAGVSGRAVFLQEVHGGREDDWLSGLEAATSNVHRGRRRNVRA